MTQEEKAKRYDEALKRVRQLQIDGCSNYDKETIWNIFPELSESEDEKIRKALIYHYRGNGCICTNEYRIDNKDIRAWLEKQGEPNPYSGVSFEYNGYTWGMCARDNGVDILLDKQLFKHLEKQSEQKPAENKVTDLVEEDMTPFQKYVFGIIDLGIEQDRGLKQVCDELLALASGEIKKSAWSEEDEENSKNIIYILSQLKGNAIYSEDKIAENCIDWFKSLKERVQPQPKQEWSEEDESRMENLCYYLKEYGNQYYGALTLEGTINWLKSLRPRSYWKPSERQKEALLWCVVHLGGADKQTLGELLEELNKL